MPTTKKDREISNQMRWTEYLTDTPPPPPSYTLFDGDSSMLVLTKYFIK